MKLQSGIFADNIPFARWGSGGKTMLVFSGGPGNTIPKGMTARFMIGPFARLARDYTIWFLSRRQGQTKGYTTRDMSDDYARLVDRKFGGSVDAVVGMSYGGLIAAYFAADHPACFRRIVLLMAAHTVSEEGKQIDYRFARLVSQGLPREAALCISRALFPKGLMGVLFRGFSWLMAPAMFRGTHERYRGDVMVEAEAECAHDAREILPEIAVPVLICVGSEDVYFPPSIVEQTARLIPRARLKLYPGLGHGTLMQDKHLLPDILEFLCED